MAKDTVGQNFINFTKEARGLFLLFNDHSVTSEEQLDMCYESSRKICSRNRKYHDVSAVFMMLLTGKSQIRDAIDSAGIRPDDTGFLIAYEDERDIHKFESKYPGITIVSNHGIPADDPGSDRKIFPGMTDVIYELNRSH